MTELNKQLVWPISIKPVNDLGNTPETGITVTKYRTGAEIRRTYQDKALSSFKSKFFLSPLHSTYEDEMVWFRSVEDGLGSFLFMNPHRDFWLNDIIGVGDGVRTTWVLPYVNWLDDPTVYLNNELISALTVYDDGPNLLTFNDSLGNHDGMGLDGLPTSSSESTRDHLILGNCYNRGITVFYPRTGVNNYVVTGVGGLIVAVASGETINAHCEMKGDESITAAATLNSTLLGSEAVGTGVALSESEWTKLSVSYTPGSLAGVSQFGGGSLGHIGTAYVGVIAATRGDLDTWYPGSLRMPTVVFDTAPAIGEVVTSQVRKANRMLRVKCTGMTHSIMPDGNRFIDVTLSEVPE